MAGFSSKVVIILEIDNHERLTYINYIQTNSNYLIVNFEPFPFLIR